MPDVSVLGKMPTQQPAGLFLTCGELSCSTSALMCILDAQVMAGMECMDRTGAP